MKDEKKITLDARAYAQIADDYFDDYMESGGHTYLERSQTLSLIAIATALSDIRDELRIMNERSNDNGTT